MIKKCEFCGKEFVYKMIWQKYCSKNCRVRAWLSSKGRGNTYENTKINVRNYDRYDDSSKPSDGDE